MYYLHLVREDGRKESYKSLSEIEIACEGIDWIEGEYKVSDEKGIFYVPKWIRKPTVSKGFLGLKMVDIGKYTLVPENNI